MPSTGITKVAAALGTFALLPFLFAQPMAATPSQPRVRVLILDGFSNHDWRQTTALLRGILEASGLFTVSVSTAPSTTASPGWEQWRPNFSDYDVLIQTRNDIGGGPSWPREIQMAFENYVRNGGGVLVFHSGNNAFPDWPVYNQMIGLGWRRKQEGDAITINSSERPVRIPSGQGENTGHDGRFDVVVHRLGDDPIHHRMPRAWKTPTLEIYYYARGPAKRMRVLSYGYDQHTRMNWPLEWTVRFGRGRVYSSTFGHVWKGDVQPPSLRCAGEQTLLLRTLQWLARRPVTVAIPADFPTKTATSIRPEIRIPASSELHKQIGCYLTTEIDHMRSRLLAMLFTVIFLPLSFGLAQTTAGLDSIPARMHDLIVANEVPGAVTVVATRDSVLRMDAQGWADPEHKSFMRVDSIFWIASMSKPITATAVLMLMEDGKLSLDDPIAKYVPELADLKTAYGKTARITLRHLLTHTSGMGEATDEEAKGAQKLSDLVPIFASKPLAFEPGSKWKYCQSGILTLGRIVEIVSDMPFEVFLRKRIFDPLGMKDTTFYLSEAQMPRWVIPAKRGGTQLVPAEIGLLYGHPPTWCDHYPASNGGLFSTAPDYARFAQMLLNGGVLDGRRYLTAESVHMMSTVQTGELVTGFTSGNGWGLGVCIVRQPQGVTEMLSPGTFGHGGAYGTQFWIDMKRGVALIMMIQRSNFENADDSPVRLAFQKAALE
jgi:CubicO group peptidase (beta-lactamase class C family)/type 1 glutamine amidotransferase